MLKSDLNWWCKFPDLRPHLVMKWKTFLKICNSFSPKPCQLWYSTLITIWIRHPFKTSCKVPFRCWSTLLIYNTFKRFHLSSTFRVCFASLYTICNKFPCVNSNLFAAKSAHCILYILFYFVTFIQNQTDLTLRIVYYSPNFQDWNIPMNLSKRVGYLHPTRYTCDADWLINPLGTGDLKFYQSQGLSSFWGLSILLIKPIVYLPW